MEYHPKIAAARAKIAEAAVFIRNQIQEMTTCSYQYKHRQQVYQCCSPGTHTHSSGKPLCAHHFQKTEGGTISTRAWRHNKKGSKV